jgi:hypothetical protein
MDEKIDRAIEFYNERKVEILDFINKHNDLNTYLIISRAKELEDIESKIAALEVAKAN